MTVALDPQRIAADPGISAFVTANAGSGKTKTLIDRVARLLLAGSAPEAILCVTYTKAAAAEMQSRLFRRLGDWSVTADADLRTELSKLVGEPEVLFDADRLSAARALFARALETPGGLKIQTIHAFCEKLLKRFPLEAGVSPGFTVMDDQAGAAIARAARRTVAAYVDSHDDVLSEAYARFSVALDYQAFESMFGTFEIRRGEIADYFKRSGGAEAGIQRVWTTCGFDGPTDPDTAAVEAMEELDLPVWRAVSGILIAAGGKTDLKNGQAMAAIARDPAAGLDLALQTFFIDGGTGTAATWVNKTAALKTRPELREALVLEQDKLAMARESVRAARVAEDTVAVLMLASRYIIEHTAEKAARGALDFTDLIEHARLLLTEKVDAAWVLYKLDGGIDHILLDEAQDTAPEQWAILRALTSEFFAGAGAPGWRNSRDERTLFVVGDEKQSIYSFQGADPQRLLEETQTYIAQITAVGRVGKSVPLTRSYR